MGKKTVSENCEKVYEQMESIDIPEELYESNGKKIMHISDTAVHKFSFIDWLIKEINPDIIIHTGDMVDDVKIGRMPKKMDEYKNCVRILLNSMKSAGEVYIVPGNHDDGDFLKKEAPWVRVLQEGDTLSIDGVVFGLAHHYKMLPEKALYYMYGHGLRFDPWPPENNIAGSKCYFNACIRINVIILPQNKFFYLPYPQEIK